MIRSYRHLWWPLKIVVWLIPGVGALAVGYALVVGDGSELPVNAGSVADVFHVCPSEPTPFDAWQADADRWNAHGCRIAVLADPCTGPPAGGVIQIRGGGDVPEGFAPPDESDHPNGTFSSPDGFPVTRGVIYDYQLDGIGRLHELGHALGWLDAERMPTSIMHPAGAGMSWRGLECTHASP